MSGEWVDYAMARPEAAGVYEWQIPLAIIPDQSVLVLAHMRERGAGHSKVLSPSFDRWDGYNVIVPRTTSWRATELGADLKSYSVRITELVGIVHEPCPFCKRFPAFKGTCRSGDGFIITANPHQYNNWWLECCSWAKTPHVADPRKLAAHRNSLLTGAQVAA